MMNKNYKALIRALRRKTYEKSGLTKIGGSVEKVEGGTGSFPVEIEDGSIRAERHREVESGKVASLGNGSESEDSE